MSWTTSTDRIILISLEMFSTVEPVSKTINLGETGSYLVIEYLDSDATGTVAATNITTADAKYVAVVAPDGLIVTKMLVTRSGGTDGLAQYQILNSDFNQLGTYTLTAFLEYGEQLHRSQSIAIVVA